MKKALILAAALSLSASVASAGGPVVVDTNDTIMVPQEKSGSGAWLPLLLGVVVIGAALSGSGT